MAAAASTSGRLSRATTARRLHLCRARSSRATGISAPPVPTSSRLTSSRCAASASIASALSRTPPDQRLIRRRSRRLPASAAGSSSGPSRSSTASVCRCTVARLPPCPRMGAVIVVAGEALIDLIVHPDGHLAAVPGGGPFNTSRAIARLGGDVAFLGRLSEDRFGEQLRGALMADGVALSFTETTDAPTTLAVAELDARGAATYRFHTADTSVPGLSSAAIERALVSAPAALHVGTLGLVLEPIASGLARAVA